MQPIQERERLRRLEEPTDLGPVGARQPRQGRGDLLLGPRPIVELTIGAKEPQGRLGALPSRLPFLIPLERRLHLLPGRAGPPGQAPRVAALPLRRARRLGWPPRPAPRSVPPGSRGPSRPAGPPAWCGRRPGPSPAGLRRSGGGAVASGRYRPGAPCPRRRPRSATPSRAARRPTRSSPCDPRPCVPRNQTMLWGSTPTRTGRRWKKISSRQPTRTKVRAARSSRLRTAPAAVPAAWTQRCTVERPGAAAAPKRMANKTRVWLRLKPMARAVTANSCCLASGNSMVWHSQSQSWAFSRRRASFSADQLLSGGSAAVLGLDGGQDLLGMIVDALSATAGLLGLLGDRAVGAGEASGGIGDPTNKGYGAHGDGSSWVWVRVNNRTHEVHPPKNQEGTGRILPSVNLEMPFSAPFGTIPGSLTADEDPGWSFRSTRTWKNSKPSRSTTPMNARSRSTRSRVACCHSVGPLIPAMHTG